MLKKINKTGLIRPIRQALFDRLRAKQGRQAHSGLTIVEIVIAAAIIAVLAAGLYSVSDYLQEYAKRNLTQSTIDTLVAAIEQYHDFQVPNRSFPFYAGKDYGLSQLQSGGEPNYLNGSFVDKGGAPASPAGYNNLYASNDALYYFLKKIPDSRKVIDSLNRSLISNKNDGKEYFIQIIGDTTNTIYPLIHILDAWQMPLRYTYGNDDNFPVIESAGPDKDFGDSDPDKAKDNISSK